MESLSALSTNHSREHCRSTTTEALPPRKTIQKRRKCCKAHCVLPKRPVRSHYLPEFCRLYQSFTGSASQGVSFNSQKRSVGTMQPLASVRYHKHIERVERAKSSGLHRVVFAAVPLKTTKPEKIMAKRAHLRFEQSILSLPKNLI